MTDGCFRLVGAVAGMRWHFSRRGTLRRISPFVVVSGSVDADGSGSRVRLRIRISYRELAFFAPCCAFVLLAGVSFFRGWLAGTKHGFGVVLAAGMLLTIVGMVSRSFRYASERMVVALRHVLQGEKERLWIGRRPGARWPRDKSRRRAARRGR